MDQQKLSNKGKRHYYKHADKIRAHRRYITQVRRDWLTATKRAVGCVICQETEPICLHWHHIDPDKKVFGIGARNFCPRLRLFEEMAKCAVVCANCHAKLHEGLVVLPPIDLTKNVSVAMELEINFKISRCNASNTQDAALGRNAASLVTPS